MKRSSFLGPVLLIGLGVVLLASNLNYDLPILDLLLNYWPVLLIAWGGLRLVEILIAASRSEPLPRAGISGGGWVLVILICLIGSGAHVVKSHRFHFPIGLHAIEMFGDSHDFQVFAEQPAGEASRVVIENLRGNVRVVGSDTDKVKVEGRTTIRAFDRKSAEETNAKCPLEVLSQGDQILVRTNQDKLDNTWKATSDLDISVPKDCTIEGRGQRGDFDVSNVTGDVRIDSDNAGVRLTGIGGNTIIDLRKSDIIRIVGLGGTAEIKGRGTDIELEDIGGQVSINGSYSGELVMRKLAQRLRFKSRRTEFQVEKTPGEIRMELGDLIAHDLAGPIRLKTRSRDVRIFGFNGELDIEMDRGDVELQPGDKTPPRINVEVRSGDIDVAVPGSAEFGLWAKTERGRIDNELDPSLSSGKAGPRGATLTGPEGKKVTIRLRTEHGDIVIRKATGATQNPAVQTLHTTSAGLTAEQY